MALSAFHIVILPTSTIFSDIYLPPPYRRTPIMFSLWAQLCSASPLPSSHLLLYLLLSSPCLMISPFPFPSWDHLYPAMLLFNAPHTTPVLAMVLVCSGLCSYYRLHSHLKCGARSIQEERTWLTKTNTIFNILWRTWTCRRWPYSDPGLEFLF